MYINSFPDLYYWLFHTCIIPMKLYCALYFNLNLSVDGKKPRSSISSPPQLSPTGTSQELSSYWTPSLSVGLSTPPSSQRNTPATSVLENSLASIHQALPGTTEHAENQSITVERTNSFLLLFLVKKIEYGIS